MLNRNQKAQGYSFEWYPQVFTELEYMVPTFPNPKSYSAMCQLKTCIKVEIAPNLMIGAHIIEHEFFLMWW
jgi:hypothetical protein